MSKIQLTPEHITLTGRAPAFPSSPDLTHGITIRDYFAGQALTFLADPQVRFGDPAVHEAYARWAYSIADAMIMERAK